MIHFRSSATFKTAATVIFIDKTQLEKNQLNKIIKKGHTRAIRSLKASGQFVGDKGEIFPIAEDRRLVLFVGLGKAQEQTPTSLRIAVRQCLLSHYLKKIKDIELIPNENSDSTIKGIIEGILIGTYAWKKYRTKTTGDKTIDQKTFMIVAPKKKLYDQTIRMCEGVLFCRDLVNDNADITTADFFEKTIRRLVKGKETVKLEVLNRIKMKQKGLNLHLAVNQGAQQNPKLIIVKYTGASKKDAYTAFVGKGITFDTGGINLKTSGHVETMRSDMAGAAALLGTLKNVLQLKLKRNLIFVFGMAENAIGSRAYKPGDVIKSYSGKTVEIGNTDAEGRLVLADAISYTIKNYKPAKLIDIATLTGACVVALGYDYTGLISNHDGMAQALRKAAQETDDRVWQLPSYPEIKDYLKSEIADIKNTSTQRGAGGTLTGAEFLRQFTDDTPWAHLDIAGTAFVEGSGRLYFGHGATGAGVRLLTEYLQQ